MLPAMEKESTSRWKTKGAWVSTSSHPYNEQVREGFGAGGGLLATPVSPRRLPGGGTQPAEAQQMQKISAVYLFHLLQYN